MPHGACTPTDTQLCYRTCGPEGIGFDPLTCAGGFYDKLVDCHFDPSGDYSCYKIPSTPNTACPAGVTIQASMECDVPTCTPCNSAQGMTGGQFFDSTGAAKSGYCVCRTPNAAGVRVWSCGSDNGSWPCPGNPGC
jgi:hypothetical protein